MGAVALRLAVPGWKRLVGMAALKTGRSCPEFSLITYLEPLYARTS